MVNLLNSLSDYIVNSEKMRCGVAILYSDYAMLYADAIDNNLSVERNRFITNWHKTYEELRKLEYTVDIVKSEHLEENYLNAKALFIPEYDLISDAEKTQVAAFFKKGGKVFISRNGDMIYQPIDWPDKKWGKVPDPAIPDLCDFLPESGITPLATVNHKQIKIQVLQGKDYYLVAMTNTSTVNNVIKNVEVCFSFDISGACLYTPEKKDILPVIFTNKVQIDEITDGAFLLLNK